MIKGIIFDLDGTLVDSRLDFELIRKDLGFSPGRPILEDIATLSCPTEKQKCLDIVHQHELASVAKSTLMEGVKELFVLLENLQIKNAIMTRNSREVTKALLGKFNLPIELIIAREDAPPKPNPFGATLIQKSWNIKAEDILFVGNYLFDIQTGNKAKMHSMLYAPKDIPEYSHQAKFIITHFNQLAKQLIKDTNPNKWTF